MTPGKQTGGRTAELSTGFVTWKAYDYAFDYALYPYVIWKMGPWQGGALMASLSLVTSLFLLWLYDRLRRDWIGIESLKRLRHYAGSSGFLRAFAWLLSRGDWVAFVVLSTKFGPFITTAYLRRGAYNGMSRRDWSIFMGGWALGNFLWTFICFGGVSMVKLYVEKCI